MTQPHTAHELFSPVSLIEEWGYTLLPPSHPSSPGATGLIVAIRAKPTDKHYDPEKVSLRLLRNGQPERQTFERQAAPVSDRPVCYGTVNLLDRRNKSMEFFTFGGTLDIQECRDETVFSLLSEAPILRILADTESLQDQFASEVVIQFDMLHARCALHDDDFERRLARFDAQKLYGVVMRTLWQKYFASDQMQHTSPELYRLLANEVQWMEQHLAWQQVGPSLENLLAVK